jgi:hypothetical protein
MIVVLLASIMVVVIATQLIWHGHSGSAGVPDLLWTGKGVDSGWAGLTWGKAWTMLSGIGGYLLTFGAHNDPVTSRQAALPLALSVVLQAGIFVACVVALWPRRGEARLRAIAVVFLGTLGAGQAMNLYSQPHDPQMQVNVMAWLTVAWALLLAAMAERQRAVFGALALLSLAPLLLNVAFFTRWRGGDTEAVAALATIEQRLPPDQTVFVYWGFEPITMWQFAMWSRTWDWDGMPGAAKFKWIAIDAGAIRHAGWTPAQHADSIRRDIDDALARGYRVVISDVWKWSVSELEGQLSGLSAANRAPAIHAMLHDNYEARQVLDVPTVGTYYELRPKPAR